MPQFTVDIPTVAVDALTARWGYDQLVAAPGETLPTKAQFVRQRTEQMLKREAHEHLRAVAAAQAAAAVPEPT